jgi:acyl carrier protein
MERVIAAIWSEVLQISQLPSITDDFFALGGNSMTMVMAEFRIMEELAIQLPTGAILTAPTVRELADLVDSQLGHSLDSDAERSASLVG